MAIKEIYLYKSLKFVSRAALEGYIIRMENKTYEEARTITAYLEPVKTEVPDRKKKTKKRAKIKR